MAEICRGCRVMIGGQPHIHVGARLRNAHGLAYATQEHTEREPGIAIVFRVGQGDLKLLLPEGFPESAAMPVIQMMRDQWQDQTMSPSVMIEMLDQARAAFKAACDNGSIVRDFQGKWHVAGEP